MFLYFLPFKVADFIGLVIFECYDQCEVGNIGILVLWRNREKLMFNVISCTITKIAVTCL